MSATSIKACPPCAARLGCITVLLLFGCLPEEPGRAGGTSAPASNPERPGNPGQPANGTPAAKNELSARSVVLGKTSGEGDKKVTRLFVHDLDTGAERLLSDLDGNAVAKDCAISPDRRTIAFSSNTFRRSPDDDQYEDAIWSIGADGQSITRLTPSGYLENLTEEHGPARRITSRSVVALVWSPDGASVTFPLWIFYNDSRFVVGGGFVTDVGNYYILGTSRDEMVYQPCQEHAPQAGHRDSRRLLVHSRDCYMDKPGLYEYSVGPLKRGALLVPHGPASDQAGETWQLHFGTSGHAFTADGDGLLVTVIPDKGPKSRLARWRANDKSLKTVYTPDNPNESIVEVVPKSGSEAFVGVYEKLGDKDYRHRYRKVDIDSGRATPLWPGDVDFSPICF